MVIKKPKLIKCRIIVSRIKLRALANLFIEISLVLLALKDLDKNAIFTLLLISLCDILRLLQEHKGATSFDTLKIFNIWPKYKSNSHDSTFYSDHTIA